MGGMFGAIGAMAALHAARADRARAARCKSALFENNVFLVAQHMMQFAVTGKPAAPMPSRISAWAIYDVFTVKDGEQIFLAVVSDTQWAHLLRGVRLRRSLRRPAPEDQQRPRAGARMDDAASCARAWPITARPS